MSLRANFLDLTTKKEEKSERPNIFFFFFFFDTNFFRIQMMPFDFSPKTETKACPSHRPSSSSSLTNRDVCKPAADGGGHSCAVAVRQLV